MAYMLVQLVNEGLAPVLLLMPLDSPCKRAPHPVVDNHIVLIPLQQGRACAS